MNNNVVNYGDGAGPLQPGQHQPGQHQPGSEMSPAGSSDHESACLRPLLAQAGGLHQGREVASVPMLGSLVTPPGGLPSAIPLLKSGDISLAAARARVRSRAVTAPFSAKQSSRPRIKLCSSPDSPSKATAAADRLSQSELLAIAIRGKDTAPFRDEPATALRRVWWKTRTRDMRLVVKTFGATAYGERRANAEATIMKQLSHPGAIKLLGELQLFDRPSIVIPEYICSLDSALLGKCVQIEPHRFDLMTCVDITEKVCEVTEHLHGKGITHNDINPRNVLLDSRAQPVLSDFEFADSPGLESVAAGGGIGFTAAVAPELVGQVLMSPLPRSIDIYGCCGVLYSLLCPDGGTMYQKWKKHPDFPGDKISLVTLKTGVRHVKPMLRGGDRVIAIRLFDDVARKGLQINPDHRQQSIAEIRQQMGDIVSSTVPFEDVPAAAPAAEPGIEGSR